MDGRINKGETPVRDTCFLLRAVQGCFNKLEVFEQCDELFETLRLKEKRLLFGMEECSSMNLILFCYLFVRIYFSVKDAANVKKIVAKCVSLIKLKPTFFSGKTKVFCSIVKKVNPVKFRSPTRFLRRRV